MPPLRISPETALKLAEKLNIPLEHLMHMPQHVLMAKLAELAKAEAASGASTKDGGSGENADSSENAHSGEDRGNG